MLAYIPAAAFVPPTNMPAPTLTLVFASAFYLPVLLASTKAKRTRLAMINTESAISFTSMMFSNQRLQQLCGPHFKPWAQTGAIRTHRPRFAVENHRRSRTWSKLTRRERSQQNVAGTKIAAGTNIADKSKIIDSIKTDIFRNFTLYFFI